LAIAGATLLAGLTSCSITGTSARTDEELELARNRQRWVDALCGARCPLALINGSADPVSGAHMVARYRELVGTGYIAELPGIGHYPQVEAPALVLEHYQRFCGSSA